MSPSSGYGRRSSRGRQWRMDSRRQNSKQSLLIALLRRPEGATLEEIAALTGWQRHTIRAVISRTLRRRMRLDVSQAQEARGRVYRIAAPP